MKNRATTLLLCLLFMIPVMAEEPALPAGLDTDSVEPHLPTGLDNEEPDLPLGLDVAPELSIEQDEGKQLTPPEGPAKKSMKPVLSEIDTTDLPFDLSGFWEARGGKRVVDDPNERDTSLAETRLQLQVEKHFNAASLYLTTDFIYDNVADSHSIELNTGNGWIDLRETNLVFSPTDFMDMKIGRQILTWGTGDLLFINDLFPKDWNAFFIGRDEEYLKAPSDAIKVALFSDWVNLDIIYTPEFDSDRFIDGRRISYFAQTLGDIAGRNAVVRVDKPSDEELALRLHRNLGIYETALYIYNGQWKSPGGFTPSNGLATFPDLTVYGVSLRGPLGKGIGNIEIGYYDSRDDSDGDDPFVNNSEFRLLLGYEQELARNLTLGVQYFLEQLLDYDNYLRTLSQGVPERDEDRHLLTARLTLLTHQQNVSWSLFTYYSPSDKDFYLRPKVNYKLDDRWAMEAGGNLFGGNEKYTFFGQFRDNSNIYLGIRYGF